MKFKIGFTAEKETEKKAPETETKAPEGAPARESLVRVYFPQRGFDCTYYNNLFDLHVGDLVYVDGKLEGKRGKGRAIVGTNELHEVEFDYKDGMIANITCDCWACGICKHGVAAVFALKSALEKIEKHFPKKFETSEYFSVMSKNTFMNVIASLGDDSVGSFVIKKN